MALKQHRGTLVLSTLVGGAFLPIGGLTHRSHPTLRYPRRDLERGAEEFSRAASQHLVYTESVVKGRKTSGLHGRYTAAEALRALLAGSDLRVDVTSAGASWSGG